MKTSLWSKCGYLLGGMFSFISVYRYWFEFHDIDRFLAYTCIGVLIMCVSWLYNEILKLNHTLLAVEDYIAPGGKK